LPGPLKLSLIMRRLRRPLRAGSARPKGNADPPLRSADEGLTPGAPMERTSYSLSRELGTRAAFRK
jgi:hypothetical protein